MSNGVKVSQRGHDVEGSFKNMVLHSKYGNPKVDLKADPPHADVFKHVINTNVAVGTHVLKSVEHNYGYAPMVLAHCVHPESDNYQEATGLLPFPVVSAGIVLYEWTYVATDDKVEFRFVKNSDDPTGEEVTIRYYIFAEPAA